MFGGKSKKSRSENNISIKGVNIIGEGTVLNGNLVCEGLVEVYGAVTVLDAENFVIKTQGDVFIAKSAVIKGRIEANNVHIEGEVHGNINAKGSVYLIKGCTLLGDIKSKSLVIEDGVSFNGNVATVFAEEVDSSTEVGSELVNDKSLQGAYAN